MTIVAVILAGGEGSRIGGEKPLRVLGGVKLIDRAIEQARSFASVTAVALRHNGQIGKGNFQIIRDESEVEGPLAGLVSALRFASEAGVNAVLILPADMPFLPADLAERLVEALPEHGAAIASSGGHEHPVCGLWSIESLGFVADYLSSGKRSLKGFANAVGYSAVDWPVEPFDPFFNINTLGDLAEAERLLRS